MLKKKMGLCFLGFAVMLIVNFQNLFSINGVILAFKEYVIFRGILNSPWVGLQNFERLFSSPGLSLAVRNTFVIGFAELGLTALLSLALIYCISRIENRVIRYMTVFVLAIPFFIPAATYYGSMMQLASVRMMISSSFMQPYFILLYTARGLWLPVLAGVLFCDFMRDNRFGTTLRLTGFIALFKLAFVLFIDSESVQAFYNPFVRKILETLGTYNYQTSLLQMEIGVGAAGSLFHGLLQAPFFIAGFIGMIILGKKLLADKPIHTTANKSKWFLYLLPCIPAFILPIVALVIISRGLGSLSGILSNATALTGIGLSTALGVSNALLCTVITLIAAAPFLYSRRGYLVMAVIPVIFAPSLVAEYLLCRQIGMLNTVFPLLGEYAFVLPAIMTVGYAAAAAHRGRLQPPTAGSYLRTALPMGIVLFAAVFSAAFGGFYTQRIYLSRQPFGIGYLVMQATNQALNPFDVRIAIVDYKTALRGIYTLSAIVPLLLGFAAFLIFAIIRQAQGQKTAGPHPQPSPPPFEVAPQL